MDFKNYQYSIVYNMKNNMKLISLFIATFCIWLSSWSNPTYPLLPYPQKITFTGKQLILDQIHLETTESSISKEWKDWLQGNKASSTSVQTDKIIKISIIDNLPEIPINSNEGYKLKITEKQIYVTATSSTGVYRALQTIQQLTCKSNEYHFLPTCEIIDWPAFRIRGFMHDVGRTYISMAELKKGIDLLSKFKINVFHWHLTENQAWRLESKIYPELNAPENMSRMPGKYYTLQEAKDLVAFCKQRHVTLIPEIDMPGHSEAFVKTFQTDMQSEKGMTILKQLMDEVCETFDTPYIHIGTDEVQFINPQFVPEMVTYIRQKGKKVISWNPGWQYQAGEIDMTQLWSYRGKAQSGIPAIDSRYHYINHFDIFADLVALYNSRIYNQDMGNEDIAGSILAIWNDRYLSDEKQIVAENNLYANMLALAERSWKGGGYGYFDDQTNLLWKNDTGIYTQFVDFENRMLWHKEHTFTNEPFPYVKQTNVVWRITEAFPNEGDLTRSFPPEKEEKESYLYKGKTYQSRIIYGAGVYLRHVWGDLIPGFYTSPKENHTAYATTWVFSPYEQHVGLFLDFQNYSRSESDLAPQQGTWDYKSSRVWLNNKELLPPVWRNTHKDRSNEIPLMNENAASRPPIQVTLQKGWNKLFLKLPVGKFKTPEVRLVKWMFNAVFVSPDGKKEIDNIIYSPNKK